LNKDFFFIFYINNPNPNSICGSIQLNGDPMDNILLRLMDCRRK